MSKLTAAVLVVALVAGVAALDATVTFIAPDGSAFQSPQKIALKGPGQCTDCNVIQGGAQQLKADGSGENATTPVILSVESAPGGTAVAFVGYGSADCSGQNQTSYFTDFQSNSVSVSTDSVFPSSVQSFLLCLAGGK